MRLLRRLSCLLLLSVAALILSGCATDPETRQLLRQIRTVAVNKNVELGEAESSSKTEPLEASLVDQFVADIDRAKVFPERVVVTNASLQTWSDEVTEMSYDAQFKLHLRPSAREGQWQVEALLQSRYGVIVWRSSKTVAQAAGKPENAWIQKACAVLVRDLQKARR